MRYFVTAKTGAREEWVEALDATHFRVAVKASPIEGRANTAIAKALARHLGIAPSRLILRSGAAGKRKVFETV
jgi:uncharacterized protein YggU (UPF0235/DUF167 family)